MGPQAFRAIFGPLAEDAVAAHAGPLIDRPVVDGIVEADAPGMMSWVCGNAFR